MADDLEFDNSPVDEADADLDFEDEERVPPKGRKPLRTILYLLLLLVLLCLICALLARFVNIPWLNPQPTPTPTAIAETPTEVPPLPTEEPTPTEVLPLPTAEPTPTAVSPTTEPTGQPLPTEEPSPTATTGVTPAPGPTATPTLGPTTEPTTEPTATPTTTPGTGCDTNDPPVADAGGPYQAMMGKGQAFVTFDASASDDPDGEIVSYEWDFGDNTAPDTGETVIHGYSSTGSFVATLTVTDNCGASTSATANVTIVGPTPPANRTVTPGPTVTPIPGEATLGFCHQVRYGQTLYGIAAYYGVPVNVLASVNGLDPNFMVFAGQGVFIPTGPVTNGPNVYEARPGDTIASVAYQCGLLPTTLAAANNLNPGAQLTPGQQLVIPRWIEAYNH